MRLGPNPATRTRSPTERYGPFSSRSSTIRPAPTGPIPGSRAQLGDARGVEVETVVGRRRAAPRRRRPAAPAPARRAGRAAAAPARTARAAAARTSSGPPGSGSRSQRPNAIATAARPRTAARWMSARTPDKCRRRVETGSARAVLRLPDASRRDLPGRCSTRSSATRTRSRPRTRRSRPIRSSDEDLQLALYLCYELHYRGLPGVSDDWEWEPSLLALRRQLEARFEAGLLDALGAPEASVAAEDMDVALRAVEAADEAPSLSRYLERDGTHDRDARVRRAPLGLPAQGGRPALVGAAAPDRRAEGRDGRDPGRRVRRRRRRAHAQRAVRQVDGPASGSTRATAPTSTASPASRSRP